MLPLKYRKLTESEKSNNAHTNKNKTTIDTFYKYQLLTLDPKGYQHLPNCLAARLLISYLSCQTLTLLTFFFFFATWELEWLTDISVVPLKKGCKTEVKLN